MEGYIAYGDKLKGEYKDAFETVSTYMGTIMVDEVTESEYLNELLDTFLIAQDEGKRVSDIVGDDIETFCKNFCSDFSFKERLYRIWDYLKSMMLIVFWISLSDMFLGSDDIFTSKSETNLSAYIIEIIVAIIVTMIINMLLSRLLFKNKKYGYKIVNAISIVLAIVLFGFIIWLNDHITFIAIPAYIPTVISAIFLAVYYACNRQRRKEHKQNRVSFWDSVGETAEPMMAQEMEKKRQRKHLEPEEFLRKEMRETRRMEMVDEYAWIGAILVYGGLVMTSWSDGDRLIDNIAFAVIMLIVFAVISHFFENLNQEIIEERKKWAEEYQKTIKQESAEK